MKPAKLILFKNDPGEELEFAVDQLKKYNRSFTGPFESERFGFIAKNDSGEVIGAVHGNTEWEWVFIKHLWVREDYRGMGLGSELMEAIIQEANKQGRYKYYLSTFEFQAPEFYKKLGFKIFGTWPQVSGNYDSFYLKREDR
ncbi:GNAT family N-acetyltransferase [Gracilimonas sp. BCB1]|uniref:GNAT family N-acetyltransferase n=1 Tax=Gracilimonas sp. BCB1 TaxID=3152362 RepID=UPI0032D8D341